MIRWLISMILIIALFLILPVIPVHNFRTMHYNPNNVPELHYIEILYRPLWACNNTFESWITAHPIFYGTLTIEFKKANNKRYYDLEINSHNIDSYDAKKDFDSLPRYRGIWEFF